MQILSLATMLFLKAFCCLVFCFGIAQAKSTRCCQDANILIIKILESNLSNGEKLEEINKIVQNGLYEEIDENLSNEELPAPVPIYDKWHPWAYLMRSNKRLHRLPKMRYRQKSAVGWDPWNSIQLRYKNSEPIRYQLPWNPTGSAEGQLNQNPYQPIAYNPNQINNGGLIPLNLRKAVYNNDRSRPYYETLQTGLYPSNSDQFQLPVSSGN